MGEPKCGNSTSVDVNSLIGIPKNAPGELNIADRERSMAAIYAEMAGKDKSLTLAEAEKYLEREKGLPKSETVFKGRSACEVLDLARQLADNIASSRRIAGEMKKGINLKPLQEALPFFTEFATKLRDKLKDPFISGKGRTEREAAIRRFTLSFFDEKFAEDPLKRSLIQPLDRNYQMVGLYFELFRWTELDQNKDGTLTDEEISKTGEGTSAGEIRDEMQRAMPLALLINRKLTGRPLQKSIDLTAFIAWLEKEPRSEASLRADPILQALADVGFKRLGGEVLRKDTPACINLRNMLGVVLAESEKSHASIPAFEWISSVYHSITGGKEAPSKKEEADSSPCVQFEDSPSVYQDYVLTMEEFELHPRRQYWLDKTGCHSVPEFFAQARGVLNYYTISPSRFRDFAIQTNIDGYDSRQRQLGVGDDSETSRIEYIIDMLNVTAGARHTALDERKETHGNWVMKFYLDIPWAPWIVDAQERWDAEAATQAFRVANDAIDTLKGIARDHPDWDCQRIFAFMAEREVAKFQVLETHASLSVWRTNSDLPAVERMAAHLALAKAAEKGKMERMDIEWGLRGIFGREPLLARSILQNAVSRLHHSLGLVNRNQNDEILLDQISDSQRTAYFQILENATLGKKVSDEAISGVMQQISLGDPEKDILKERIQVAIYQAARRAEFDQLAPNLPQDKISSPERGETTKAAEVLGLFEARLALAVYPKEELEKRLAEMNCIDFDQYTKKQKEELEKLGLDKATLIATEKVFKNVSPFFKRDSKEGEDYPDVLVGRALPILFQASNFASVEEAQEAKRLFLLKSPESADQERFKALIFASHLELSQQDRLTENFDYPGRPRPVLEVSGFDLLLQESSFADEVGPAREAKIIFNLENPDDAQKARFRALVAASTLSPKNQKTLLDSFDHLTEHYIAYQAQANFRKLAPMAQAPQGQEGVNEPLHLESGSLHQWIGAGINKGIGAGVLTAPISLVLGVISVFSRSKPKIAATIMGIAAAAVTLMKAQENKHESPRLEAIGIGLVVATFAGGISMGLREGIAAGPARSGWALLWPRLVAGVSVLGAGVYTWFGDFMGTKRLGWEYLKTPFRSLTPETAKHLPEEFAGFIATFRMASLFVKGTFTGMQTFATVTAWGQRCAAFIRYWVPLSLRRFATWVGFASNERRVVSGVLGDIWTAIWKSGSENAFTSVAKVAGDKEVELVGIQYARQRVVELIKEIRELQSGVHIDLGTVSEAERMRWARESFETLMQRINNPADDLANLLKDVANPQQALAQIIAKARAVESYFKLLGDTSHPFFSTGVLGDAVDTAGGRLVSEKTLEGRVFPDGSPMPDSTLLGQTVPGRMKDVFVDIRAGIRQIFEKSLIKDPTAVLDRASLTPGAIQELTIPQPDWHIWEGAHALVNMAHMMLRQRWMALNVLRFSIFEWIDPAVNPKPEEPTPFVR